MFRLNMISAFRVLLLVVLGTGAAKAQDNVVQVSVPEVSARPGDEVLVPVQIAGLEDEIVAGEIRVQFDPTVLRGLEVERRGSLIENQRWLTADQINETDATAHVFQAVFAAASGFSENGDILFLAFEVDEAAEIGTIIDLELTLAAFNNGTPTTELSSGSLRVVEEIVKANFVARPRRGSVPLEVQFNENSVGTIDTYAWDFGDGNTSDEQNPQHIYTDPDSYTVGLTVTGESGQDTETKFDYIAALPDTTPPVIIEGPKAVGVQRTSATILWVTNEFSTSVVEYSTREDFPDSETVIDDALVKAHKVELIGLQADTKYYYRVRSTDAASNASRFKRGFFRTRRAADTRPPVVTKGPAAEEITDVSAAIVWRTNEESTSIVEYLELSGDDDGEDFGGAQRVEDEDLVEDHKVELAGLAARTRYIYRVRSVDEAGNESNYKRGTFRTRSAPDTQKPVIVLGPVAIGRTHQGATIKWVTNEPVGALVNYGTGTDYGFSESREERRSTNLIRLTNLEPSTLYHYQVISTDAADNSATSEDFEFITRSKPDLTFPKIVLRPFILGHFSDRLIVRWKTDEPCLGVVEYGDDEEDFEFVATSEGEGREHTVVLTDLDPGADYRFRISATDLSGNGPVFSAVAKARTLKRAAAALPRILQGPIVANRGSDRATVSWRTNLPTDGFVEFGPDETYGNSAGSAELGLKHEVVLSDLAAATTYHFRAVSTDPDENEVASDDQTLTTRAAPDTLPPIFTRGPAAVGVGDSSAFIAWITDEPADALVEFGPDLNYGESVFEEEFAVEQRLSLTGLEPGQNYHFRVNVRDRAGNGPTVSGDVSFTTLETQDMRPPAIIAGPGSRDVRQDEVTIVWRTNEPADSFVDFGLDETYGSSAGSAELTRDHQVTLTNLAAGTEYHYRALSTDLAGNISSTDPNGNERWSRPHTVRTLQVPDTRDPVIIRGPVVLASNKGAVISFKTDERCIARLAYGTAQTLGTPDEEVVYETEPTTRHNIRIGNLEKNTRYLFLLTCVDAAGNELVVGSKRRAAKVVPVAGADDFSGALEFSTEEEDDVQPPVITEGPTLVSRTSDTAIIEWTTDEPADSFVDFGIGGLTQNIGDAEYTQEHSIVLTGLESSTPYTYQVSSTDFAGNAPATSQTLSFTTQTEPDLVPPALAAEPAVVFVDDSQAIIEWTTDEPASVEVLYGPDAARDLVFSNFDFASEHAVHLAGLQADTDYTYLIRLSDPSGNGPTESAVLSFSTAGASDVTPPELAAIVVGEVGDVQAIIEWTTDEPASSFVFYGVDEVLDLAAGDTELLTKHRVVLTNLSPSTTYNFAVESLDPAGNTSGQSASESFVTAAEPDVVAPVALDGLAALIGLETAIVTWPSTPEVDLASYTLYRQIRSGPFEVIATGLADTSYTDAGLFPGSTYNYYVTATDLTGNESEPSNEAGGTPSIRNVPGQISPFGSTLSGDSVTLQVSNAQAGQLGSEVTYTFHVSTSELFDDIVARASGVAQGTGSTSWSFEKELEEGVEYWWRARASDGVFDGPWSFPSFFDGPEEVIANPGDFDADGSVGFADFFIFVDKFGLSAGQAGYDEIYDLDGTSPIGFSDFFIFVDLFGTVYSSPRSIVDSAYAALELLTIARLEGDDVVVEVRSREAAAWRGLGLLLRYDPQVLTWMGEEARRPDLMDAAPEGLYAQIATGADEIALFAHRRQSETFSGEGSIAYLRFRAQGQVTEAVVELAAAAVQTSDGIARLEAPQSFTVRLAPDHYALRSNYPNPFNPETTIAYDLPADGPVYLAVYDILGQEVRVLVDQAQVAGRYRIAWNGLDRDSRPAASGVYFFRLEARGRRSDSADLSFSQVRKMLLLR